MPIGMQAARQARYTALNARERLQRAPSEVLTAATSAI